MGAPIIAPGYVSSCRGRGREAFSNQGGNTCRRPCFRQGLFYLEEEW